MKSGMQAHTRYIRQSARKVRLVASLIRGMSVDKALGQLGTMVKAARMPIEKTLRSAVANAEHNFQKSAENLFIKEIQINQGAVLKRWRPRAFGRAAPIHKHSCHILIVLDEVGGAVKKSTKSKGNDSVVEESGTQSAVGRALEVKPKKIKDIPPHDTHEHKPEIFDKARTGKHEGAQHSNKPEKKGSMMKKILTQRKTG